MAQENKCTCSNPAAQGWHLVDEVTTTYETLKKAQLEAGNDMAQYIADVFFTKDDKTFYKLMEAIANGSLTRAEVFCEWDA